MDHPFISLLIFIFKFGLEERDLILLLIDIIRYQSISTYLLCFILVMHHSISFSIGICREIEKKVSGVKTM